MCSLYVSASLRKVDFVFLFQNQIKLSVPHCNGTVILLRNDLGGQSLVGRGIYKTVMWSVLWSTNSVLPECPRVYMDPLVGYIGKMRTMPINFCFICLNVNLQIITLLVKHNLSLCDETEEAVIFTSSGYVHYHHYQLWCAVSRMFLPRVL